MYHSCRGSQYASLDYQARLADQQIQVSMSRTGNCYDNAVMESFWATLKTERTHDQCYQTRAEARTDFFSSWRAFTTVTDDTRRSAT